MSVTVLFKIDKDFSISLSLFGVSEIEHFIGREEELAKIKKAFQGDESYRKTVLLQGLGGIGKTQLAVNFVKRQRNNYSAIFWLNSKTEDVLKRSFANMAKRLHNKYSSFILLRAAAESKDANQIIKAINRWLSAKGNTR